MEGNGPCTWWPDVVARLVSPNAQAVYRVMCQHAREKDRCWVSKFTLYTESGMSLVYRDANKVDAVVRELEHTSLVKVERSIGRGHVNTYILLKPPVEKGGEKGAVAHPFLERKGAVAPSFTAEKGAVQPPIRGEKGAVQPPEVDRAVDTALTHSAEARVREAQPLPGNSPEATEEIWVEYEIDGRIWTKVPREDGIKEVFLLTGVPDSPLERKRVNKCLDEGATYRDLVWIMDWSREQKRIGTYLRTAGVTKVMWGLEWSTYLAQAKTDPSTMPRYGLKYVVSEEEAIEAAAMVKYQEKEDERVKAIEQGERRAAFKAAQEED